MSLRISVLSTLFLVLGATRAAHAGETSIGLLGGYASEVRRTDRSSATSYGWGVGARLEHRYAVGLYLGGALVMHRGSSDRAEDDAGVSTYRADRHAMYTGPELGWELQTRSLFVRPYLGAGAWYVMGRTVVRDRELSDNGFSPYVMPGLFLGYRAEHWNAGLDVRLPMPTELPMAEVAPTLFFGVGFTISRPARSLQLASVAR